MKESGLDVRRFRFLDQESGAVDWAGIREDLQVSYDSQCHSEAKRGTAADESRKQRRDRSFCCM
jgi:hypothetical protein